MKINNQKGFIIPLVIVIIAVIALGGGVYVYTNEKVQAPVVIDTNVPAQLNQTSTTTVKNTTLTTTSSDWKTYTNVQYGFEIKYPVDWKIIDKSELVNNAKNIAINIESPFRYDLSGYQGIGVSHRILIYMPDGQIASVADFGSEQKPASSWWNTNVTKVVKEATSEYKIGQQIISTFKFTSNSTILPPAPVITYVSSVESTPEIANGQIVSGAYVYMTGSNLGGCTNVKNCETAVYIGDKKGTIGVSSAPSTTALAFTAPVLADGIYDLYLLNLATGQKSNVVKANVVSVTALKCSNGATNYPHCNSDKPQIPILPSVTVLSPNGGETISYGDIYMAGDLNFRWSTSQPSTYLPSQNFKAYIIDETGKIIRNNPQTVSLLQNKIIPSDGIFGTSFAGESNLQTNTKYKIKVCDNLNYIEYCDSSDGYFIIK